mmetsp:Transcript_36025/g.83624  ORF Transcript_36025/g.83624 Transcript_36025/m.83624 type:complete len:168 (+) Transcript_36025:2-505(+)
MADELRQLVLPAAAGSVVMILSNLESVKEMGPKFRYKKKEGKQSFEHPYRPWEADMTDPDDAASFRLYKATQNQNEWLLYTLPCLWSFNFLGGAVPYIGRFTPFATFGGACAWAYFNGKYAKGYTQSAEGRLPGFRSRLSVFKFFAFGSIGAMACVLARSAGIALPQ